MRKPKIGDWYWLNLKSCSRNDIETFGLEDSLLGTSGSNIQLTAFELIDEKRETYRFSFRKDKKLSTFDTYKTEFYTDFKFIKTGSFIEDYEI